jgi:hypothetical protein
MMIRRFSMTAAIVAAGTICMAAPAGAQPPPGETDVPNMHYNAVLGAPCDNWTRNIFGRAPNGQALACVASNGRGTWVLSAPLRGVQVIGDPCPPGDAAAQSPDGRGLICEYHQGWQPNSG